MKKTNFKSGKKNGRNNRNGMGYDDAAAMAMYSKYDANDYDWDEEDDDMVDEVYRHHSTTKINDEGNIEKTETIVAPADSVIEEDIQVKKEVHDTDTPISGDCEEDKDMVEEGEASAPEYDDVDYESVEGITDELYKEIEGMEIAWRKLLVNWHDDKVAPLSTGHVLHMKRDGKIFIDLYNKEMTHRYGKYLLRYPFYITCKLAKAFMLDHPEHDKFVVANIYKVLENRYEDGLLMPDYRNEVLTTDQVEDLLPCERRIYSARIAQIAKQREADKKAEQDRIEADNRKKEQERIDAEKRQKEDDARKARELEEYNKEHEAENINNSAAELEAKTAELLSAEIVPTIVLEEDDEIKELMRQVEEQEKEERRLKDVDDAKTRLDKAQQDYEAAKKSREDAIAKANKEARNKRIEELKAKLAKK